MRNLIISIELLAVVIGLMIAAGALGSSIAVALLHGLGAS